MSDHTEIDPELQHVLSAARRAAYRAVAQPSPAVAARLGLAVMAGSESVTDSLSSIEQSQGDVQMVEPTARFGMAAKIAVATAVLALGLTGVGAAGALPGPAQDAFDGVVAPFVTSEEEVVDDGTTEECVVDDGTTDDGTVEEPIVGTVDDGTVDDGTEECVDALPVGSKEFSSWVVQGAQDPDKVGSEFGASVSEQARELKNEKAEERAANAGSNGNGGDEADDDSEDEADDETAEETSNERGKPAGAPGGRP